MAAELAKSAWKVIPMFRSRSVQRTTDFYSKKLGFKLASVTPGEDPEEQIFCSVFMGKKAQANLYFLKAEEGEFTPSRAMIALGTEELDQYYEHLQGRGDIDIAEEISETPWGFRQFSIRDDDGNSLTFFKFIEGGNPGRD